MTGLHLYFRELLKKINPTVERQAIAAGLPGDVRDWLREHSFKTENPHTRLSGSYARDTAILDIKDVDVLLFLPSSQLVRTPNALLQEVKKILDDYTDTTAEASPQRRSVHLEFPLLKLHLDIVPAVAEEGLEAPLRIPDRPAESWILSDPLGYAKRLTSVNQANEDKVVPLIKLFKAWRDAQMKQRRPKSYVLEVMTLYAVEEGKIKLKGRSRTENFVDLLSYVHKKHENLMQTGKESPRIPDPQVKGTYITKGWERTHFETFMRRLEESNKFVQKALDASNDDVSNECWTKVFGELWPSKQEITKAIKLEALSTQPGKSAVTNSGRIVGTVGTMAIPIRPTTYHGYVDDKKTNT